MSKMLRRNCGFFIAASACYLASTAANAASVTYSGSYNGPTDVTDYAINVQQFDPSLGTLTGVTISLSGTVTTQVTVNNDGNFNVGLDFYELTFDSVLYRNSFSLAGAGSLPDMQAIRPQERLIGSGTPDGTFASGEMQNVICPGVGCTAITGGYVWTTTVTPWSASQIFALAPDAQFIGSGNLLYSLTTETNLALGRSGTQTMGQPANIAATSTNVLGTVDITYDYAPAPVPLPAAAWLLLSGIAGLGVLRRRKAV